MPITTDARINFEQTIVLDGPSAIVSVEAFGGPVAVVQIAVFDAQDRVIDGVGFNGSDVLVTNQNHTANWLFTPRSDAAYIKWGILPKRLSAGLGGYSISGKVRDHNGNTIAVGRFSGTIPDGESVDDPIYDGVMVSSHQMGGLPGGAKA